MAVDLTVDGDTEEDEQVVYVVNIQPKQHATIQREEVWLGSGRSTKWPWELAYKPLLFPAYRFFSSIVSLNLLWWWARLWSLWWLQYQHPCWKCWGLGRWWPDNGAHMQKSLKDGWGPGSWGKACATIVPKDINSILFRDQDWEAQAPLQAVLGIPPWHKGSLALLPWHWALVGLPHPRVRVALARSVVSAFSLLVPPWCKGSLASLPQL